MNCAVCPSNCASWWICTTKHSEALAHRFADTQDVIFLGRGINYPIALEGALKLKEISYIHAEGYPAGEMKHGPIALLDSRVPVVSIAVPGVVFEKVLSNAQEAKARDAQLIGVAPQGPDTDLFDELLPVPSGERVDQPPAHRGADAVAELSHRRPSRSGCGSTP